MEEKGITKKERNTYLFIVATFWGLAGLFIGFGLGFLAGNIPGGIFVGLGLGFIGFGIALYPRK